MLWTDEALTAEQLLRELGEDAVKHSARYLRERNRRLYDAIVLALSYGIPVSQIEKKVGVSENTIRAVAFHEAASVEEGKEQLKNNLRKFLNGAAAVLAERYEEIPLDKLPVAFGIINQNLQLLEGGATTIVRHEQVVSIDDMAALIEAAQKRANGHVVEEAPDTGLEAEEMSAMGGAGAGVLAESSLTDPIPASPVHSTVQPGTSGEQPTDSTSQSL